jgi:hypothetical protein
MAIFFIFIEFYCGTINPMLPRIKFQNGAHIQDGRQYISIEPNLNNSKKKLEKNSNIQLHTIKTFRRPS